MAVVAIHAVVDVAADAPVVGVGLRLGVAVGAGEHGVIIWIRVAGGAHSTRAAVVGWEPGVVEGRIQPAGCAVAGGASRWESCRNVIRVVGRVVVGLVTRIAVRRNGRVVVVDMTHGAGHRWVGVKPGKRKCRVVVIERSRNPRRGAVADIALLRNPRGSVIGRVRSLVVLEVARDTSGAGQVVVVVNVAHGAGHGRVGMEAGQRKTCAGVIELRRAPAESAVTNFALLWHASGDVVGVLGSLIIRKMTEDARRAGHVVIVVDVTLVALQGGMPAAQGEPERGMIHAGRLPQAGAVTVLARHGETEGNMIRIAGLAVIVHVAAGAGGRCALELSSQMTVIALQAGMSSGEGESSELQVIKLSSEPGRDGVALLASRGESGSRVAGCVGLLKITCMARVALERESLKLSGGRAFVAGVTLECRVCPNQWKAILVILYGTNRDVPALNGVTTFTACAHLTAMDVGMAVGTPGTSVGEHGFGVTARTRHIFMPADQGIAGAVMIELRHSAYRFPAD